MRVGERPTATLMHDPFYGHRDSFSGDVEREPFWLDWDYALATALQTVEDYTDAETGQLVWVEQSSRVTFDAQRYTKKSIAAIDRKTSGKNYKAQPGERWRAKPVVMDGGDLPTMREWIEEQSDK